jgi:hypothetical protein
MPGPLRWWVALWDRKEPPDVLALVRIGIGLVLLYDLLVTWRLGLVGTLMATVDHGGLGPPVSENSALWLRWVGADAQAARWLHGALTLSALSLTLGLFSRTSALLFMLLSAQWAMIMPEADRAIETMMRNVLFVLMFSGCGRKWSLDAWLSVGSVRGDGSLVSAAPRYLLVLQVVVMYFTAGVQKYGQHWWPWGGYTALYVILHDWAYAAQPFHWLRHQPFYLSTQLATAVTMIWQWSYPVVLLHYFPPSGPPGRFRQFFARYRLHWAWIAVGALFHVLIGATMELGIFPTGMLAIYPAFLHPDELRELATKMVAPARVFPANAASRSAPPD